MNSLCIVQYKGVSKRFETDVISKGYDFINQIASIPKKLFLSLSFTVKFVSRIKVFFNQVSRHLKNKKIQIKTKIKCY